MNDFMPLGPPLPRPVIPVEVESILATTTPGVYRVDGKLETFMPENEWAHPPHMQPRTLPTPPTESAIDFILFAMERLKDPEFPTNEWGTW